MTYVSKLMHLVAASLIGYAPFISAQTSLHADERINGKLVWQAFEPQRLILQESSAVIYTDGRSRIRKVYGIVVSREGHIVTKASEIVGKKNITLRVGKNVYENVEIVGFDHKWDVALLKVEPEKHFSPVDFAEGSEVAQGYWVVSNGSASRSQRRVRVGIISAETREIKSAISSVILGVQLGSEKKDQLQIKQVSKKSGAEKAGLKVGDVLFSVGGVKLSERSGLVKAMIGMYPGDLLSVEVMRGDKKISFEVELMPRTGGPKLTRNEQMSGGALSLSKRRDGFPRVIHHDTPLTKESVGGPLLNLEGKCIGMNIARASRVATYAIPVRELREIVADLRAK